jgi:hypothetical protein
VSAYHCRGSVHVCVIVNARIIQQGAQRTRKGLITRITCVGACRPLPTVPEQLLKAMARRNALTSASDGRENEARSCFSGGASPIEL